MYSEEVECKVLSGTIRRREGQTLKTYSKGDRIFLFEHKVKKYGNQVERLSPEAPPPEPEVGLIVEKRGDGEGVDLVNENTGEPLNDTPMSEPEAEEVVRVRTRRTKIALPDEKSSEVGGYRLEHVGGGWYWVIDETTGKPAHDNKVRKDDAEQLKADMERSGAGNES